MAIGALEHGGRAVIPAFRIGASLDGYARASLEAYGRAPSVAQFMHAFQSSEEFRENINPDMPEWFGDFIDYSIKPSGKIVPRDYIYVHLIQKPEGVWQKKGGILSRDYGKWMARGGKRIGVILPPRGIPVPDSNGTLYEHETGLPVATTQDYDRALRELEKIMSHKEALDAAAEWFMRYDEVPADATLSPISREKRLTSRNRNMRSLRLDWHSPEANHHDTAGYRIVA